MTLCRPCWFTKFMFTLCPAPFKGIQGSLGFWISRCKFQIPGNWIPVFVKRTWILDSSRLWDSGFHIVNSGFQVTGFQYLSKEQGSLGFWISRCKFQIPGNWIPVFVKRTWILDSSRLWDSGFHIVNSGFQVTGFQSLSMELGFWIPIDCVIPDSLSSILDSKNPGFQIPKAKIFQIPESGFPYLGRYVG